MRLLFLMFVTAVCVLATPYTYTAYIREYRPPGIRIMAKLELLGSMVHVMVPQSVKWF